MDLCTSQVQLIAMMLSVDSPIINGSAPSSMSTLSSSELNYFSSSISLISVSPSKLSASKRAYSCTACGTRSFFNFSCT